MTNFIEKYEFNMSKKSFQAKRRSGHFNGFYQDLAFEDIKPTFDNFWLVFDRVGSKWGWSYKDMYADPIKLKKRLLHKQSRLLHLLDNNKVIGYAFVTKPSKQSILSNLHYYNINDNIIEIENLGLFPGQEGQGRGGKFFEMIMEDLFRTHDHVYWSSRDWHSPTLMNYYQNKFGMDLVRKSFVEDVRPDQIAEQKVA